MKLAIAFWPRPRGRGGDALRDSDMLVRFGGDEFVAVLPDCTPQTAERVLARARAATAISCSAGVAWWREGDDVAAVLARADEQLYEVKRQRRDGTPIASVPSP
jgi:diguanylate cyclase (GGDEF)-like protein